MIQPESAWLGIYMAKYIFNICYFEINYILDLFEETVYLNLTTQMLIKITK